MGEPATTERGPNDRRAGCDLDTRTRLLAASGPVFAAHGFEGATVRDICAAADVNIASVGYYFGDKLGLYREVIQGIRDVRERQFPIPDESAGDPRKTLLAIVRTLLSRMLSADRASWETQLLMREMHDPTPVFESIVQEFFRPLFKKLIDTMQLLIGTTTPKHTLEQLALSVVGQCLYYRVASDVVEMLIPESERVEHYNIDSLSRHITAVMLAATGSESVINQKSEIESWLTNSHSEPTTS
jgi:AcrR family transcriptional regulator